MSLTNFQNGVSSFGIPVVGAGPVVPSGNVWFVSSVTGGLGDGTSKDFPLATLQSALNKAVSGDVIFVLASHAETISAAAGMTTVAAGVTVVGLGNGATRPTLTFATSTAATFTIAHANFKMSNIVGTTTVDQIVSPFVISAAGCNLDIEWQDGSAILEALRCVLTTAAADKLTINLRYIGFPAGSNGVNAIRLVGCNDARINIDYYGKCTTAVVEFVTTLCTDVNVTGYSYLSGTTNGSKIVVDTVTGSTWTANVFDGAAAANFSGGSGAAMASDDVSAIASTLTVPTADVTTNTNERDVIGNKTDAAVTANGTTKSLMAYQKGLITMGTVQTADATNNAFAGDVIGNKTDASVYAPSTTKSVIAYVKGNADLQEGVVVSSTAVMANGNTLFTTTGPIEILSLVSECVTSNDATASTLQYQSAPTTGAATTFSGASASLANVAAGGSAILQGTSLATAPVVNASGAGIQATGATNIYVPAGTIKAVIGTGSTTGTWRHLLRYRPLAKGVTVS